ncbi:DUF2007 domain-containing protein [Flavobacteriaceae bacterium M23B6Z8]
MEQITLKTFDNPIDAHLLKTKLESEGIPCYLMDENLVTLNPLFNISVGGIKLKVHTYDLQKALEVLQVFEKSLQTNSEGEAIKCPKCSSEDIYTGFKSIKGAKGILSAIISFIFMVFPLYYKTVNKCNVCGNEFPIET